MKQRRRFCDSAAQRSEIYDRWQAGESMNSIGRPPSILSEFNGPPAAILTRLGGRSGAGARCGQADGLLDQCVNDRPVCDILLPRRRAQALIATTSSPASGAPQDRSARAASALP